MTCSKQLRCILSLLFFIAGSLVHGATLNWSNISYTDGSLLATFSNVDNSGVDIRVTISDPDNILRSFGGRSSPYVSSNPLTGGFGAAGENLFLYISANATKSLTLGFDFFETGTTDAVQVSNVSFIIFDVDKSGYVDEVRSFSANNSVAGTSSNLTSLVAADSSFTQVSGSGASLKATGLKSASNITDDGSVTANFGNTFLTDFSLVYGYGSGSQNSSSGIGIYDINFSPQPIPEPGTYLLGACLLMGATLFEWRRRRSKTRH